MASAAILAKAAAVVLTDEGARKKVGWALVVILSPAIVVLALICSLATGTSDHNVSVAQMCFHGGAISSEVPDEYRMYIEDNRAAEISIEFQKVLAQDNAVGIRTKEDKQRLADAWLDLAVSCAKIPIKYEADQLKQQQKQEESISMVMR